MPIRGPATNLGSFQPSSRGWIRIGPSNRLVSLRSRSIPSAWVSLPGPLQRSTSLATPRRACICVDALDRLQRADQDGGADLAVLADRVEQRVDAVGAVDVGLARVAEEHRGPRGQPDVGVAGRLGVVVGLGLDDHARAAAVLDDAADQVLGDLQHRAVVEGRRERHGSGGEQRAGLLELLAHARQRGPAL